MPDWHDKIFATIQRCLIDFEFFRGALCVEKCSLIQKWFYFSAVASSEEEIDDEEPELVIEESADDIEAEENVERLTASGISVTVIEKNKQSQPHQQKPKQQQHQKSIVDPEKDLKIASDTAKTNKESMGLSSDISVTVVHKKKIDVGGTSSSGPKISVKKESELLVSIFLIYSSYVVE